jgi:TonB family protein
MKATIGHHVTPEEVMQLADGELQTERAAVVSGHMSSCAECQTVMAGLRKTSRGLASWTDPSTQDTGPQLEALRKRVQESGQWWRVRNLLRPRYLVTAGALMLALTILAQMSPSRIHLQEPEVRAKLKKTESPTPRYPEEARQKGIQGVVRLHIVVNRSGSLKSLDVVAGDPILAKAAMEGVRKWKFEPTYVNGKAVEVDSVVEINFQLVD